MRRTCVVAPALLCVALVIPRALGAQESVRQSSARVCTGDSMPKNKFHVDATISAFVYPYDPKRKLSKDYEQFIAIDLRDNLHFPRPLPLDTYESMPVTHGRDTTWVAEASIWSAYRVVLHQDGHVTGAKAVGGIRNRALDSSIVSALVTVDTMHVLPPVAQSLGRDGLEVRIEIRAWSDSLPPHAVDVPLARMQLPVFDVDVEPPGVSKQDAARYPFIARQAAADGDVMAAFVIEPSGAIDRASIQFLSATALPFAESALESLLQTQFVPMRIAGCPVRTVARMPFEYRIKR